MAGHYFRPESLLPAKKIQLAAARFLSLLLCDEGLLTIKCVGPAIPLIGNIAVAPKGNQPLGPRFDTESAHLRQITSGGLTHDEHLIRIDMEKRRSTLSHPMIGVTQIFNNGRQLDIRCQPVINRDHGVTSFHHRHQQRAWPGIQLPISSH